MIDPAIAIALDAARSAALACARIQDMPQAAIVTFLRTLHAMTPSGVVHTAGGETYTADCARLANAIEQDQTA